MKALSTSWELNHHNHYERKKTHRCPILLQYFLFMILSITALWLLFSWALHAYWTQVTFLKADSWIFLKPREKCSLILTLCNGQTTKCHFWMTSPSSSFMHFQWQKEWHMKRDFKKTNLYEQYQDIWTL